MTVQLADKIKAILIASKTVDQIANVPGLTLDIVIQAADRNISMGIAKMQKYDPTGFFQAVVRDMQKSMPSGSTKSGASLNSVAIQVGKVLRNDKSISDFRDLQKVIDDNYSKISGEFETKLEMRRDDDISDLLDVAVNKAGTPKPGFEEFVPGIDTAFRKWGDYSLILDILKAEIFMPILISGLSGTGKSINAEQACAELGREYIRLQITPETDETDMIGGFQLVNGETVFEKGPVIRAMERGAVLCIDEIDRGSNRLMALQGVAEGKPVLIKKTGEIVKPAPGFTIVATANTKGQGDDTGKFSAATILDEAFLERFTMVLEQGFAPADVEIRILAAHMVKFGANKSRAVLKDLIKWGEVTRQNFRDGKDDAYISTRRLCHIMQIFAVTKDLKRSVALGVSRYDENTKESLIESFKLLV